MELELAATPKPNPPRDTLDDGIGQLVGTPEGCDPYEYWESDE